MYYCVAVPDTIKMLFNCEKCLLFSVAHILTTYCKYQDMHLIGSAKSKQTHVYSTETIQV